MFSASESSSERRFTRSRGVSDASAVALVKSYSLITGVTFRIKRLVVLVVLAIRASLAGGVSGGGWCKIAVLRQPDLLALVDANCKDNETRPEAIHRILKEYLTER